MIGAGWDSSEPAGEDVTGGALAVRAGCVVMDRWGRGALLLWRGTIEVRGRGRTTIA